MLLSTQHLPVVLSSPVLGTAALGKTVKIMNAIVATRVTGHGTRKMVFEMSPGSICTSGMGLATIRSWKSRLRAHESFSANESTLRFSYQINMRYLLLAQADVTAGLKPISRALDKQVRIKFHFAVLLLCALIYLVTERPQGRPCQKHC